MAVVRGGLVALAALSAACSLGNYHRAPDDAAPPVDASAQDVAPTDAGLRTFMCGRLVYSGTCDIATQEGCDIRAGMGCVFDSASRTSGCTLAGVGEAIQPCDPTSDTDPCRPGLSCLETVDADGGPAGAYCLKLCCPEEATMCQNISLGGDPRFECLVNDPSVGVGVCVPPSDAGAM